MVWPALIAGGASLLGGLLASKSAKTQNKAAAAQSAKQMAFQERMSNTAHQRQIIDLRAAGLNPILSGMGGSGASTPGGAQAPVVGELSAGVNTALSTATALQTLQNMRSTNDNIKANTALTINNTQLREPMSEVMTDLSKTYSSAKSIGSRLYQWNRRRNNYSTRSTAQPSGPSRSGAVIHINRGN